MAGAWQAMPAARGQPSASPIGGPAYMGADGTEPGAATGPGMYDWDDLRAGAQVMSRGIACI